MTIQLNPDMLAQYRGCNPENYCYSYCCDAADYSIQEKLNPEELEKAATWAAQYEWI